MIEFTLSRVVMCVCGIALLAAVTGILGAVNDDSEDGMMDELAESVADVLDRHRRGQVKAAVLERTGINADLTIVADGDVSMEAWRLEELRPDFEDLFGVRLRIHTDPVPERKVL